MPAFPATATAATPTPSGDPVNPSKLGEIDIQADAAGKETGAKSPSGSGFCGSEERISNKDCDSTHPAVAFDPAGNIGTVWSDTRDGNAEIYARFLQSRIDTTVKPAEFDPSTGKLNNSLTCSGFSSQSNKPDLNSPVVTNQKGELTVNKTSQTMVLTIVGTDTFTSLGIVPGSIVTGLRGNNANVKMVVSKVLSPTLAELTFDSSVVSDPDPTKTGGALFSYSIQRANASISTPEVRLTCNRGSSQFPDMVADKDGRWHIVFQDNSTGNFELYYIQVHPKGLEPPDCTATGDKTPITALGFAPVPEDTEGSVTIFQTEASATSGGGTGGQPASTPASSVATTTTPATTDITILSGDKMISYPVTGENGAFFAFGDKNLTDPVPITDGAVSGRTGRHRLFRDFITGGGEWTGASKGADRATWDQQAIQQGLGVKPDFEAGPSRPDIGENDFGTKFNFKDVAFIAQTPPDKSVEISLIALSLKPPCLPKALSSATGSAFQNIQAAPKKPVPPSFADTSNLSDILTSPLVTFDENVPDRFTIEGDTSGTVFTNILMDNGRGQLSRFMFSCDRSTDDQKPLFILGQVHCGEELCALFQNKGAPGGTNNAGGPAATADAAADTGRYNVRLQVWAGPDYRFVDGQIKSAQFKNAKMLIEKDFAFDPGSTLNVFKFKPKELIAPDGHFIFFVASAGDNIKFFIEGVGGGNSVWSTSGDGIFDQYYVPFTIKPNAGLNVPVYYEGYLTDPTSGVKVFPAGTKFEKDCGLEDSLISKVLETSPSQQTQVDLFFNESFPSGTPVGHFTAIELFKNVAVLEKGKVIIQPFTLDRDSTLKDIKCLFKEILSANQDSNATLDCIIIPLDDASIAAEGRTDYTVIARASIKIFSPPHDIAENPYVLTFGESFVPVSGLIPDLGTGLSPNAGGTLAGPFNGPFSTHAVPVLNLTDTFKFCERIRAGKYALVFTIPANGNDKPAMLALLASERLTTDPHPLPDGFAESSLGDTSGLPIFPVSAFVPLTNANMTLSPRPQTRHLFPWIRLRFTDELPSLVITNPDGTKTIQKSPSSSAADANCSDKLDFTGADEPAGLFAIESWNTPYIGYRQSVAGVELIPMLALRFTITERKDLRKVVLRMVVPKYTYSSVSVTQPDFKLPTPSKRTLNDDINNSIVMDIVKEKTVPEAFDFTSGVKVGQAYSRPDHDNIVASSRLFQSQAHSFENAYNWSDPGGIPQTTDCAPVEFTFFTFLDPGNYYAVIRTHGGFGSGVAQFASAYIVGVNQRVTSSTIDVPRPSTSKNVKRDIAPMEQGASTIKPTGSMDGFVVGQKLTIAYLGNPVITEYKPGDTSGNTIIPGNATFNPYGDKGNGNYFTIDSESASFDTTITAINGGELTIDPPTPTLPAPQSSPAVDQKGNKTGLPQLTRPKLLEKGSTVVSIQANSGTFKSAIETVMISDGAPLGPWPIGQRLDKFKNIAWGLIPFTRVDLPSWTYDNAHYIKFTPTGHLCFAAKEEATTVQAGTPVNEEKKEKEAPDFSHLIATAPLQITQSKGDSVHPRLAIDSHDIIWLTFFSDRTGANEVYVDRNICGKWFSSAQGGSDFRVSNAGAHGYDAQFPNIAVDELGDAHVVWHSTDTDDGRPEIFYAHSIDGGKSFIQPKRLTSSAGDALMPDIAISSNLAIASSSGDCQDAVRSTTTQSAGQITVVWHDSRFGQYEIMSAPNIGGRWYSSAFGAADTRITQALGDSLFPHLAADHKGNLRTVYHDFRRGTDNPWVFMSTFIGSKNKWDSSGQGGLDQPLTPTGDGESLHPDLAIDALDGVFTTWQDDRFGAKTDSGSSNQEVMGTYCGGHDSVAGYCGPICTNVEAFLKTSFDIVDPITHTAIQATNVPQISLRINAPGSTFYRVSEDGGKYSDWTPFRPATDLDTVIADWTLGPGVGKKRICVQVQDAVTVGFPICKDIVLRTSLPEFKISFFKDADLTEPLPRFGVIPAAAEGDVYIKIGTSVPLVNPPTFDVISKGIRLVFNQQTIPLVKASSGTSGTSGTSGVSGFSGSIGSTGISAASGMSLGNIVTINGVTSFSAAAFSEFAGRFTVYRDDGFFHIDGPARIVLHGKDVRGQSF